MAIQRQITINRVEGSVKFDPEVLEANKGDQIFWTNNDDEAHWPGMPGQQTFFMPNQIAPHSTSSVFSPGAAETYDYICSLHKGEGGTIKVT